MKRLPVVVVAGLILLLAVSGCTGVPSQTGLSPAAQSPVKSTNNTVEKVEVFHFHRTQQFPSCIAIGNLTENTLQTNFNLELASGRLVFAHVGYELPENAALSAKYGVTGSSLWIGVYDADGFHKEQDTRVWSLINDNETYSAYFTDLITKRLNGDLS
jgi:hypothetical protein